MVAAENEKNVVDDALIDAELFMKYRMPDRAVSKLREVAVLYPANTDLRWKLSELFLEQKLLQAAAEELVALANIYVASNQYDFARLSLLKLKEIFPNAPQVDTWISALDQKQKTQAQEPAIPKPAVAQPAPRNARHILSGDLHYISLFDVIQTAEKNQITGIIYVTSQQTQGTIYFNKGLVADAILGSNRGKSAFKLFAEITEGIFELERSPVEFQPSITTTSNAQLILEIFSEAESEESTEF
jgi:hypothetical protein